MLWPHRTSPKSIKLFGRGQPVYLYVWELAPSNKHKFGKLRNASISASLTLNYHFFLNFSNIFDPISYGQCTRRGVRALNFRIGKK